LPNVSRFRQFDLRTKFDDGGFDKRGNVHRKRNNISDRTTDRCAKKIMCFYPDNVIR
jgi:hypothetical protein